MGARREITAAVVDRYRSAGRADQGRTLDELCAVTGWHRKHAVWALASHVAISPEARRQPKADLWRRQRCAGGAVGSFGSDLRQAAQGHDFHVAAFAGAAWPAQSRSGDQALVLGVSAATIDRLLFGPKLSRPAVSAGGSAFDGTA
jgi:hypothetical protein